MASVREMPATAEATEKSLAVKIMSDAGGFSHFGFFHPIW